MAATLTTVCHPVTKNAHNGNVQFCVRHAVTACKHAVMACTVPIDLTTLSLSHGVLAIFVTVLENEKTAMYMDIYTHIHSIYTFTAVPQCTYI